MGIDRLKYFALVVETGSLRKAAEIVGISPGSMSKAVAALAAELGVELLAPVGRGIEITKAGMEVYQSSVPLLDEVRKFQLRVKGIGTADPEQTLRIASFEVFSTHFLAAFLANASLAMPVTVLELGPGDIENSIRTGLVDYGLTYVPAPSPDLEFHEIGVLPFEILGVQSWSRVPFDQWPFAVPVTPVAVQSSQIEALDLWPRTEIRRWVKYQFHQLETALQMAKAGLAVVHVPQMIGCLINQNVPAAMHLVRLGYPPGLKSPRPPKAYLVGRKGEVSVSLERKLAAFLRSLRSKSPSSEVTIQSTSRS